MVKFIHAADLHLDSPFIGLKHLPDEIWSQVRQSTFTSLHRIISTAIKEQVDFVVFSGDIYDLEDRSVKAQVQFNREMERLNEENISAFVIHGNHDYVGNQSLHLSLAENVHVFDTEIETVYFKTKDHQRIAISGFSYAKRWINDRKIQDYPKKANQVDFHIGLLHGFQEGNVSEHNHYAPFSVAELEEKRYDYWALGHIHKRQKLSKNPPIYYSGNTQGRQINESGEKGILLVEETRNKNIETQFISTAPIIWEQIEVDVSEENNLNSIFQKIQSKLPSYDKSVFIRLTLTISDTLLLSVRKKLTDEDFIDALQKDSEIFLWIVSVKLETKEEKVIALEKIYPESWKTILAKSKEESFFEEKLSKLFNKRKISALTIERNREYREKILDKALGKLNRVMDREGE